MNTGRSWFTAAVVALSMSVPTTVRAHGGHFGDHSWLTPSLDHYSVGFFLALLVAIGVASAALRRQRVEARPQK